MTQTGRVMALHLTGQADRTSRASGPSETGPAGVGDGHLGTPRAPGRTGAPQRRRQYLAIRYTDALAGAGALPSVGSVGDSYDCTDGQPRPEPNRSANMPPGNNTPRWSASRAYTLRAAPNDPRTPPCPTTADPDVISPAPTLVSIKIDTRWWINTQDCSGVLLCHPCRGGAVDWVGRAQRTGQRGRHAQPQPCECLL